MKLYTEKDIANAVMFGRWGGTTKKEYEDFLKKLTPIELPSDEEIDEYVKSTGYYGHCTHEYHEGIQEGAKWLKNKIQGGNNEQQ